jgi:hypothetical protein
MLGNRESSYDFCKGLVTAKKGTVGVQLLAAKKGPVSACSFSGLDDGDGDKRECKAKSFCGVFGDFYGF